MINDFAWNFFFFDSFSFFSAFLLRKKNLKCVLTDVTIPTIPRETRRIESAKTWQDIARMFSWGNLELESFERFSKLQCSASVWHLSWEYKWGRMIGNLTSCDLKLTSFITLFVSNKISSWNFKQRINFPNLKLSLLTSRKYWNKYLEAKVFAWTNRHLISIEI